MDRLIDIDELERRLAGYDWNQVMYDPLHDFIEADTDDAKQELAAMEGIVEDMQLLRVQDPGSAEILFEKYWAGTPMEGYMLYGNETTQDQIIKHMKQEDVTMSNVVMGLEKDHVIANEVVNKAEIESLTGSRFLVYNTTAYFLSSRQVHFFKDERSASEFILEHQTKAYKLLEFDSVQDMLRKIPYGSIVAEAQEKYSLNKPSSLSEEVSECIKGAIAKGENWMVFNQSLFFIDPKELFFFNSKEEAQLFAENNVSDRDRFHVMHTSSVEDILFLNTSKTNVMNEQNAQYLKDNIKYMGFGEGLAEELEKKLKEAKPDFQLQFKSEMGKKPFEATLNFCKSDSTDMYFFNSYTAKLERNNGESKEQLFYLDKGKGITAKEAFNLLEGRAVLKDLTNKNNEPYKAWVQLDFNTKDKHNNFEVKQYHENYGYDLRAAVGKLAVSELGDAEKEKALMQSLQKGNVQSVSIDKDGSSVKMFIEANPQFKTVNVYDGSMKRVQKEDLVQYQAKQMVKEPTQSLKQEAQKKTAVTKAAKSTDSLLPKKRTSQKKGLGIS